MNRKQSLVVGAVVVGLLGSLFTASSASAEVSLSCPYGDARTAAQKLPKPGVVVKTEYTYFNPDYDAYTIDEDGGLSWISIETRPSSETEIVAAWQNGTSCYGSEISRNSWAVSPNGQVYSGSGFSGPPAAHFGDASGLPLNKPVVGMSPTSSGRGYWLVATDGGIFTYGDARFYGSTGNLKLDKPVNGMSVTPSGNGYWMVASDGGIFTFGDARFLGSMGGIPLDKPITGMTATPSGNGYWMVASDGGIFTFGDAVFKGSTGGRHLSAPIAGMVPNGTGYTLIGQDGQLYPFQ